MTRKTMEQIMEQLDILVGERLQVMTYKAACREFQLQANTAKQLLFEYAEKRRDKVSAVYCVTGWTKGAERKEIVQLVTTDHLEKRRAELDPVRGVHVYSVQPRIPKVPAEIFEADKAACEDEMAHLLQGGVSQGSWLADNRFSGIKAPEVKRDPASAAAAAAPAPVAPAQPLQEKLKPKASSQGDSMNTAAASKTQGKSTVAGMFAKANAPKLPPSEATTAKPSAPASAPSGSVSSSGPTGKRKSPQGKGGKGSLGALWAKVPPKKETSVAAPKAAAPPPELKHAVSDDDDDEDMENDEIQVMNRANRQRRVCLEDDDEDEGDEEGVPVNEDTQPTARRGVVVLEGDEEEGREGNKENNASKKEKQPSKRKAKPCEKDGGRSAKRRGKAATDNPNELDEEMPDADDSMEPSTEEPKANQLTKMFAKKAVNGRVFLGVPGASKSTKPSAAAGKWVEKTYFNDRGDEVTELVFESAPESAPESACSAPPAATETAKQSETKLAAVKADPAATKGKHGGKAGSKGSQGKQRGIMAFMKK